MANLTIVVDDALLKRARMRALEQGVSVNALLRNYLETFAGRDTAQQAVDELLAMSQRSDSTSGEQGRDWTRDGLYDR